MAQEGTSDRACDRCRERRVKCDKRIPSCQRCEKLGKPCPGYDKKRKFVDEGITLRKKYQASSSRTDTDSPHTGARDEFDSPASTISFQVEQKPPPKEPRPQYTHDRGAFPRENHERSLSDISLPDAPVVTLPEPVLTRAPVPPPFADPALFPETTYTSNCDPLIDDIFSDPNFDPEWFNLDPDSFYSTGLNSCGFIPDAPNIVDEVDRNDLVQSIETGSEIGAPTPISLAPFDTTWAPATQLQTSALITDEREHEMAYLIRHFTEAIGPWMDLFDEEKHFGNLVPLKALRDALLRNAIAAVAAKQLGRVKGHKAYLGSQTQKPAAMEVIDDVPDTDWFYKAANYYDKAIAFSRVYLQAISGTLSNPPSPDMQLTVPLANSDDLLVAVSIFSLYESLDNVEIGWLPHLAGLKTLLSAVSPDQQSQMQVIPSITVGRRASFWNFARADYQAAYINHQRTLLNTEDLDLWRSCGLQIQGDYSLYPNPSDIRNDPLHCRQIAETVAHTLLWLVLRVMNYLASDNDETPTLRQPMWLQLTRQLDEWYTTLPQTFQPCAQIKYPLKRQGNSTSASYLTEVFFSMNVCAAALQLYHFARILLLLNKPIESQDTSMFGSGGGQLKPYRSIPNEAVKHAHQIVGIALGRPHPAVRVEMLLPLYIAGMCLEADEERRVLLELLRAIEQDTGCSTEGRCVELMREWGWSQEGMDVGTG